MLGLTVEEAGSQTTDVWDCNWQSVLVFEAMATQWRVGMSGPTGLDYSALPAVFSLLKVTAKKRDDVFADVRVMEDAALKFFSWQQKHRSPNG